MLEQRSEYLECQGGEIWRGGVCASGERPDSECGAEWIGCAKGLANVVVLTVTPRRMAAIKCTLGLSQSGGCWGSGKEVLNVRA